MDAAASLRVARHRAGLTLRALAERAGTSHSALAAYEGGRTVPTVATLDRILRAAGYAADLVLSGRAGGGHDPLDDRGRELIEVLELAAQFPSRHDPDLLMPPFPAAPAAHPNPADPTPVPA